ncbi:MAG: YnfA family protein [candidate division NC10 bacterium]|nr:YnfA family protein [candidate division NC10 bacterium]
MVLIGKSVALFVLAGLFEIGGGYLVWQWWRNGAPWFLGAIGAIVLFLYGVVPTYQPAHFGRVYAAYGGWFVVLSILWGWGVDRLAPDRYDLLGGLICLLMSPHPGDAGEMARGWSHHTSTRCAIYVNPFPFNRTRMNRAREKIGGTRQ